MIYVYSAFWYEKSDTYEIRVHTYGKFEDACLVVAEMMNMKSKNTYTIVDNRDKGE